MRHHRKLGIFIIMKAYWDIVSKAKKENREKGRGVYYEAHHIIPKCLGGQGSPKAWKLNGNLVLLTREEHIECHRLLCVMYPEELSLQASYIVLKSTDPNKCYTVDRVEPRIPHLCKTCGERNSDNFHIRQKSMCKKCSNKDRSVRGGLYRKQKWKEEEEDRNKRKIEKIRREFDEKWGALYLERSPA